MAKSPTFTKVKDGKHKGEYLIRVQYRDVETGKLKSLPRKYARTKSDALKLWSEMTNQPKTPTSQEKFQQNTLLATLFEHWANQRLDAGLARSESARQRLNRSIEIVNKFAPRVTVENTTQVTIGTLIRSTQEAHAEKWKLTTNGVAGKTATQLRQFFDETQGYRQNPVPKRAIEIFFSLDEIESSGGAPVLTWEQLEKTRKFVMSKVRTASIFDTGAWLGTWLATETGARTGEILGAEFGDIHQNNQEVIVFNISKFFNLTEDRFTSHVKARITGENRDSLALSDELVTALREFEKRRKKFLDANHIDVANKLVMLDIKRVKRTAEAKPARIAPFEVQLEALRKLMKMPNLTVYSFRKTIAIQLVADGVPIAQVAQIMGHTPETLMRYYIKPQGTPLDVLNMFNDKRAS